MKMPIDTLQALDRISRHCPEALHCYLQCINRCDEENTIVFTKSQVEDDMSLSWTIFKNNIKKLALEDLLEWHRKGRDISVTLAEIDDPHEYNGLDLMVEDD